jgi:hypothetical protein
VQKSVEKRINRKVHVVERAGSMNKHFRTCRRIIEVNTIGNINRPMFAFFSS